MKAPDWDDQTENRYEDSLIGSGESMLPAIREVASELAFLEELRERNLTYPVRSDEADAELAEIEREIASLTGLLQA